jgi:hypothetical protein
MISLAWHLYFKLFISAYPVFLLHNKSRLRRWPAEIQHVYFVLTGMCIAYWTLGGEILNSLQTSQKTGKLCDI